MAVGIPGRSRMALAVHRGDLRAARRSLDEAMAVLRCHPGRHLPFRGLWALLSTVEDDTADGRQSGAARAEVAAAERSGALYNGYCLRLAEAVALGRRGRHAEAAAVPGPNVLDEVRLGTHGPWSAVALASMASAALRDGWGEGEAWMRLALGRFDERGLVELASWCRKELRGAGRAVPRRGRGRETPPSDLLALGVTSREVDVLHLLATGATNKEIAARLHLSPRTVERHVSNLLVKTGAADRRGLRGFGAESRPDGGPGGGTG